MKPRVLFVIGGLAAGGSETQLSETAARLHGDQIDAHVLVQEALDGPRLERLEGSGIPVIEVGVPEAEGARFALIMARRYGRILRAVRPDVVYAWLEESALFIMPSARLHGVPVVVARRNVSGARMEAQLLPRLLIRAAERRADLVTVNSRFGAAVAVERGVREEIIRYVPNGLPGLDAVPPPDGPPVVIGYLGRMRPEKGHFRFLRTLAQLPPDLPWRARLGGDGLLEPQVRDAARSQGLSDRIEFLGEVRDVPGFWNGCHIAALLSDHEGSPNALAEAARAARPIVATSVGGTPELVPEGAGFLVEPDDDPSTVESLTRLIADRELRLRMGRVARAHVLDEHNPERSAAGHLEAMREALAG